MGSRKRMWMPWQHIEMDDKADEVVSLLEAAGCLVQRQCACVYDGAEQCENFMSYCPGGTYLRVPIGWEHAYLGAVAEVEDRDKEVLNGQG